jgi:hypothetical protein
MWPKRCQVSAVVVAVTQTRVHIKKDTTFKQAATAKWTRPRVGYNNYTHHASLPPLSTYLGCLVSCEGMFWAPYQNLDNMLQSQIQAAKRERECENHNSFLCIYCNSLQQRQHVHTLQLSLVHLTFLKATSKSTVFLPQ